MSVLIRFVYLLQLLMIAVPSRPLVAGQAAAYQQAVRDAASKQADAIRAAKEGNLANVPGYQGGMPPESSLSAATMGDQAVRTARNHPAQDYFNKHLSQKQKFDLDGIAQEDFIKTADKATAHPEKTIQHVKIESQGTKTFEEESLETCEEGGDEYQTTCTRHLEIELKVTPERWETRKKPCSGHWYATGWGSRAWHGEDPNGGTWVPCDGCETETVLVQHKKVEIVREEWVDTCKVYEEQADKGLCTYVASEKGPKETRIIEGELVTRDSWHERNTYRCLKESKKNCAPLRARGCVQVKSKCIEKVGDVCVLWRQTYQCKNKKKTVISYKATGQDVPFCLGGDCVDASYEANGEMADVLSQLSVLKQAGEDIRQNIGVFTGQVRACRKNCIGFRDCCTTGKGWGMSLHLAECSGHEKELAQWRQKKLCVLVGTYCAEKKLGVCIRKKTSFCCFGTKLSKLIQEQGRAQLGLTFGDPKCPDCRGLTPDELSRLDFSRMDMSELFEEIRRNVKVPDQGQVISDVSIRKIQANMKQLTARTANPKAEKEKGQQ